MEILCLFYTKDMHKSDQKCPELTEKTAEALDDEALQGLFIITQRNNLDQCFKFIVKYDF